VREKLRYQCTKIPQISVENPIMPMHFNGNYEISSALRLKCHPYKIWYCYRVHLSFSFLYLNILSLNQFTILIFSLHEYDDQHS